MFLGRACLAAALHAGHRVTVFNRGKARSDWPGEVEVVLGDRKSELTGSADVAGMRSSTPAAICRATSWRLHRHCARPAAAISSCRACRCTPRSGRRRCMSRTRWRTRRDATGHGHERKLRRAEGCMRGGSHRSTGCARDARPAGTHRRRRRPNGRFSYWPWRSRKAARSSRRAGPSEPCSSSMPWTSRHGWWPCSSGSCQGHSTPPGRGRLHMGRVADGVRDGGGAHGAPASEITWVDEDWLIAQQVAPWSELPLWVPSIDPEMAAFDAVDIGRAIAAGLRTRPLEPDDRRNPCGRPPPASDPRRSGKLTRERESALISSWQNVRRVCLKSATQHSAREKLLVTAIRTMLRRANLCYSALNRSHLRSPVVSSTSSFGG